MEGRTKIIIIKKKSNQLSVCLYTIKIKVDLKIQQQSMIGKCTSCKVSFHITDI